ECPCGSAASCRPGRDPGPRRWTGTLLCPLGTRPGRQAADGRRPRGLGRYYPMREPGPLIPTAAASIEEESLPFTQILRAVERFSPAGTQNGRVGAGLVRGPVALSGGNRLSALSVADVAGFRLPAQTVPDYLSGGTGR